ncbi:MAG TPA: hypothetical protein DCR35_02125 [Runella sp.]|nr:hypothetical protein [Runella sp.]
MNWLHNTAFIIGYYLKRAHWLSLDVVAGAMLTHTIAQRMPDGHGKVSWASTLLVGIAVFAIYVADRLLDNRKSRKVDTQRHRFHAQHEPMLLKILAGLGVVGLVCLFWLPKGMFIVGLTLAVLVVGYLVVIFRTTLTDGFQLFKEPIVALIYTAGVWWTALSASAETPWESKVFMGLFGLVAFQNLLLFSWFESFDMEEGYTLAIAWGTETVSKILMWISIIVCAVATVVLFSTTYRYCVRAAITVSVMGLANDYLKRQSASVLPNERYRWLGDGVFFFTLWLV